MKRTIIAAAALAMLCAGAMSVTGCGGIGTEAPSVGAQTPAQAAYLGELAFAGAVATVERGVASGALRGENAAKAAEILPQAKAALDKLREAKGKADTVGVLLAARDLESILAGLAGLAPPL